MNKYYLEWLFLKEHLSYWINTQYQKDTKEKFYFNGKEYNVQKMKDRFIKLTEKLLEDYKL